MNAVFVIDHLEHGGAERVVSVLTKEMVNKGHKVSIIAVSDSRKYEVPEEINYVVAVSKSKHIILRKVERAISIRRIIKGINPDVVYSFGYYMNLYSIVALMGMDKKLIISERTDPNSEPQKSILRFLRNLLYSICDVLVCQTSQAKEYFPSSVRKKTVVIPNPIMSDLPVHVSKKRRKEIVNACRLEKQKNLPALIMAFAKVHAIHEDYVLSIYGDGQLIDELKKLVHDFEVDDSVCFHGFCTDVHDRIKDCGMFVSSSNYEGISNSVLEAMGMGLPVICTDCPVGGNRMLVQHRVNGLLVPVGDVELLVKSILFYIENPQSAEEYGKEAIKVKKQYNASIIADKWIELV